MRILQICHKPPRPAVDGGCLAIDAITAGLMGNGAEVKVLTAFTRKHPLQLEELDERYIEDTQIEGVPLDTGLDVRDAYVSLLNGESYNISRFHSHQFAMVLKKVLSKQHYDVVHLESLYTTPYIETIRMHAPTAMVSLRSHNHEFQIWEQRYRATRNPINRLIIRHLTKTLERYEKSVLEQVDAIVAISSNEAMGYRNWGYKGPLHVSGFGIESHPVENAEGPERRIPKPGEPIRLFHLGAMDWAPNMEGVDWFVNSVWPTVRASHPHAELHLAGKGLKRRLWSDVDGVFNHGEVRDARKFSNQHDLLVVPLLRGAGIRVKVVEAMSQGIPVASTSVGMHGLELMDGESVVQAEPGQFAETLVSLLNEPHRLGILSKAGRKAAFEGFDQIRIGSALMDFYGKHVH